LSVHFIYPLYSGILAIILYCLVPRKSIRRLFIYGVIFGSIIDFAAVIVFTFFLGIGGYINYGPFGFMGIPFFPLIAWCCYFILYFYFLPNKPYVYLYPIVAALYSTLFSNILQNIGIFKWILGDCLSHL
jgi:hypothetical protein